MLSPAIVMFCVLILTCLLALLCSLEGYGATCDWAELALLTNLRELTTMVACVGNLPPAISALTNLTQLHLKGNLRKARFEALLPFQWLRILVLERFPLALDQSTECGLERLPAALEHLPALTQLELSGNCAFCDWAGLARLHSLQGVRLCERRPG
jgi:Leucine-rich repeat (LRR) protein